MGFVPELRCSELRVHILVAPPSRRCRGSVLATTARARCLQKMPAPLLRLAASDSVAIEIGGMTIVLRTEDPAFRDLLERSVRRFY